MDFRLREHLVGMGIDVEMQVQLPPAGEGQPWFALDVGNAGVEEGGRAGMAPVPVLVPHRGC